MSMASRLCCSNGWQSSLASPSLSTPWFASVKPCGGTLQQEISLRGHELVDEWRDLQAQATLELCPAWFDHYREVVAAAQPQHGEAKHYRRRWRPIPSWIPSAPWQSS